MVLVFFLAEFIAESKKSPTDDTKTLRAIEALKALKSDSKPPKQVKGNGNTKNKSENAGDITQSAANGPVDIEFSKWDKELPNIPDLPITTPGTEIDQGLDKSNDKGSGKDTSKGKYNSSVKEGSAEGIIEKIKGLKEQIKDGNETSKIQNALCVIIVEFYVWIFNF